MFWCPSGFWSRLSVCFGLQDLGLTCDVWDSVQPLVLGVKSTQWGSGKELVVVQNWPNVFPLWTFCLSWWRTVTETCHCLTVHMLLATSCPHFNNWRKLSLPTYTSYKILQSRCFLLDRSRETRAKSSSRADTETRRPGDRGLRQDLKLPLVSHQ